MPHRGSRSVLFLNAIQTREFFTGGKGSFYVQAAYTLRDFSTCMPTHEHIYTLPEDSSNVEPRALLA